MVSGVDPNHDEGSGSRLAGSRQREVYVSRPTYPLDRTGEGLESPSEFKSPDPLC